jgi:hypothetical protein
VLPSPDVGDNVIFGITVKAARLKSPLEPVAATGYWPNRRGGGAAATVNFPVRTPPETLQVEEPISPMGAEESEHELSELANPVPVTPMVDPGVPDAGLRVRVGGDPTLKRADAESPMVAPATVTMYIPTVAVLATVNPPVSEPVAVILHEGGGVEAYRTGLTGVCSRVHKPLGKSAGKKKAPETVTTVPMLPEVGLTVSTGVTVNDRTGVPGVAVGYDVT